MNANFQLLDVLSSVTLSIFSSLLIFLVISKFQNARKQINFFIFFALNFAIYLMFDTGLNKLLFRPSDNQYALVTAVTAVTYFLLTENVRKMFIYILKFPASHQRIFIPYFASFAVFGFFVCYSFSLDFNFYSRGIYPWALIFATFCPAYLFTLFTVYVIRKKSGSVRSYLMLAGFFIFYVNLGLEEILTVLDIRYPLKGSYIFSIFSVPFWSLAMLCKYKTANGKLPDSAPGTKVVSEYPVTENETRPVVSDAKTMVSDSELNRHVNDFLEYLTTQNNQGSSVSESLFDYRCYTYRISAREKEIICLLTKGYSYKKIAEELNIAEKTVSKHTQNIYRKTNTNGKIELMSKLSQ